LGWELDRLSVQIPRDPLPYAGGLNRGEIFLEAHSSGGQRKREAEKQQDMVQNAPNVKDESAQRDSPKEEASHAVTQPAFFTIHQRVSQNGVFDGDPPVFCE
jgi:hypothetical protein